MSDLGVVIIGRNEGERLKRCLASLGPGPARTVYVDSGSTDGSREHARSVGADVVELDRSVPFTAARARNAGFARLRELVPEVRYVQFIDGDCELLPGWCDAARQALDADEKIAALCGQLRERSPEASVYNRLGDMEWRRPAGDTEHCGGIFMARADAFARVGGFDPAIAAGEEPDLCCRLRGAGFRIVRLDVPMATHDLNMTRFPQWWRRSERGGYGALRLTLYGPAVSRGVFRRQVRSALLWGVALPAAALTATLGAALSGAGAWSLLALALWPLALGLQGLRLAAKSLRAGRRPGDALAFAFFTLLWKYAAVAGFVRCLLDRRRERAQAGAVTREFHKSPV